MNAKTLDVQVIPSSDPRLVVAATERDLLRVALRTAIDCRKGDRVGLWYNLIDYYRSCMARGKPGLPHRRLQSLLGVFDDAGEDFEGYQDLATVSVEEAAYCGLVLSAERIRCVMERVAEDFQEAVVGPADDLMADIDEGDNIVEALILQLTLHAQAADNALAMIGKAVFEKNMPAGGEKYILSIVSVAQTVVVGLINPLSAFSTMGAPNAVPSMTSASESMFDSWVAEIFQHLSDPEILSARRPASQPPPELEHPRATPGIDLPGLSASPESLLGAAFQKKKNPF